MSYQITVNASISLMRHAQAQTRVASLNMANSRVAGYTRKTVAGETAVAGGNAVGVNTGHMQNLVDKFLLGQMFKAFGESEETSTLARQLKLLAPVFGKLSNKKSTLSGMVSDIQVKLTALKSAPGTYENSKTTVRSLQTLALQLNKVSQAVQDNRAQASSQIETAVAEVNQGLSEIHRLNREISEAKSRGETAGFLEDQRNQAVKKLSGLMDVNVTSGADGSVRVFSKSGTMLLGSEMKKLAYSSPAAFGSKVVYPAKIGGIMAGGADLTREIGGGRMGALIRLRDDILPRKQAEVDELAKQLVDRMNEAASKGAAYPPGNALTGSGKVKAADALAGTGNFRIAVTGADGVVKSIGNVSLSGVTTVGGLVTKLDALPGVSASINSAGKLEIKATNSNDRLVLDNGNASVAGSPAKSIARRFGFNDIFSGGDAASISIRRELKDNPGLLPKGTARTGAALAVGKAAVSSGDGSGAARLLDSITGATPFSAAGQLGAQAVSFEKYASKILADITAQQTEAVSDEKVTKASYTGLKNDIAKKSGVNMNEEVARMTQYQQSYQAGARILATTQTLFNSLLQIFAR